MLKERNATKSTKRLLLRTGGDVFLRGRWLLGCEGGSDYEIDEQVLKAARFVRPSRTLNSRRPWHAWDAIKLLPFPISIRTLPPLYLLRVFESLGNLNIALQNTAIEYVESELQVRDSSILICAVQASHS